MGHLEPPMNDADWFKKFRRGKRGGCTLWAVVALGLLVGMAIQ